jgi:hypothetical protein
MMKESTLAKHKLVVDEWFVNGRNGTQAYLKIYPKTKENAAAVSWNDILINPKIVEYIAEKEKSLKKTNEITLESIMAELDEMAYIAKKLGQPSAGVSAIKEKAKLAGLYEAHNAQKRSPSSDQWGSLLDKLGI